MAEIYNSYDNTLLSGTSGNDTIANGDYDEGGGENVTINAGKGNDSISNYGENVTINGGAGKDYIYNSGGYEVGVKIEGGKGNDTIVNEVENPDTGEGSAINTIIGGDGNDVFSYSSGNDVITDYTANEDYIRLYKCSITGSSVKGKNVILKTTTGNITIKNGKGKEISVLTTQVYGSSSSALFEEDNFAAADNLSSIVENNLSVTDYKISTNNFENLAQEKLITFTAK